MTGLVTVLSERLVKSRSAMLGKPINQVNDEAELGPGYIYRLWNTERVQLSTVNKIAKVLECRACDLMEEIETEGASTGGTGGTVYLQAKPHNNGVVHIWEDLGKDGLNAPYKDFPDGTACQRVDRKIYKLEGGIATISYYKVNCEGVIGYVEVEQVRE